MVSVNVVELTDTTGVFEVRGVTPSFLNAIRRTMMSSVPKLAIEDVTIYDNTSALFDEMVAHRLGLLPVPTDLNAFNRRYKDNTASPREGACPSCSGEGCASCTVLYTLSKEGPATVYSGDLVPAADAKFKIVDPKIPIVKLLEGQRVMLEAGAILGTGIEHAKWACVTAVGYQEYPVVTVKGPIPADKLDKVQRTMPPGAFSLDGSTLRVLDPVKAAAYLRSAKKQYGLDTVDVTSEPDRWLFRVETDGALSPQAAIRKAVSMVMEKLKTVEGDVQKLKMPETEAPPA
jgi:DNA-directed RNA polymerase subunit D